MARAQLGEETQAGADYAVAMIPADAAFDTAVVDGAVDYMKAVVDAEAQFEVSLAYVGSRRSENDRRLRMKKARQVIGGPF